MGVADGYQLVQATSLANRRGVKSISTSDLIFLIRHDKAKVSRLKTFLSWKDVRKNVKDSDDKGGGDAGDVDFDDVSDLSCVYRSRKADHPRHQWALVPATTRRTPRPTRRPS